jgi:hypothetical protein
MKGKSRDTGLDVGRFDGGDNRYAQPLFGRAYKQPYLMYQFDFEMSINAAPADRRDTPLATEALFGCADLSALPDFTNDDHCLLWHCLL